MSLQRYQMSVATVHRAKVKRFATVALPAAAITMGLFVSMQNLVEVDDFSAPPLTVYELQPYIDKPTETETPPQTIKIIRQDPIAPPPRPQPIASTLDAPEVPNGFYDGAAPADYGVGKEIDIRPQQASSVIDRTLQPITPPVPNYPRNAIRSGAEGSCEVSLSVSPRGDPFHVYAECSNPVFERAAKNSVEKVRFAPQIRNGMPVTVTGVVYPLEFRLKQ